MLSKKIHSGNIQVDLEAWLTVGCNTKENDLEICLKCRNVWLNVKFECYFKMLVSLVLYFKYVRP